MGSDLPAFSMRFIYIPVGFPDGSEVKNPPSVQEMQIQSLGSGRSPGEEMATHSSLLAWEILWTQEL